jgi:hypothetical protein
VVKAYKLQSAYAVTVVETKSGRLAVTMATAVHVLVALG